MSRELLNVNNTDTIKQNDDSTTIILSAHDDNEPRIFKAGDVGTIHISTSQYHIPSIPAKLIVGSNNVNINSADLVDLPAGKYSLELWVSQKDGPKTTIYPSSGALALTIDKNADDLTNKTLTTLTLDDLRKDLHADVADAVKHVKIDPSTLDLSDYAKKVDVPAVTLDVDKRTLTINKQTINIPDSVDLSGYAKTADVPSVKYDNNTKTLTVNGVTVEIPSTVDLSNYYTKEQVEQQIKNNKVTVDLTDYVKREDLADLAKKTDVPAVALDTEKRTLTINGTAINIPDSVDLSGYATKAELPKVILDVESRKITIGDASLNIPASVDLSNYYTKAQIDDKLASAVSGGKVDLSGYVKTSQLDDYAKKTDVPNVVYDQSKKTLTINGVNVDLPNNIDLSDYVRKEDTSDFAKKTDIPTVPTIALNTAKRTLTVNGNVINIPDSVDLTGYVKVDQLSDYARKSDIPAAPDLSQYALKSDIKPVDLTPYIHYADEKYATRHEVAAVNSEVAKVKDAVVAVAKQAGKDGKRGPVIWQSSETVNSRGGSYEFAISQLTSQVVNVTPAAGDVIIAQTSAGSNVAFIIASQDGATAKIDSNVIRLTGNAGTDGAPGSNGHSVWMYNASAANLSVSITGLMNYDSSSQLKPQVDDIVIGNDGSVAKITSVGDYGLFSTGEAIAQIKAKSSEQKRTPVTWHHQYTTSIVGIDKDAGKTQDSTGLLESSYWNGWQSKLPQNQQVYPLVGDVVVYQDKVIKLITWSDGSGNFKTDDEGDVKAASMTLQ